ncbi:MAG: stage II sporulation protein M [Nitrospinota bacterium]|nr:stage II sporulation protein M [Nitrospinota bacterium]
MDFNTFIKNRRPEWARLGEVLDQVDKSGMESLNPEEAEEFFTLYRRVSSDLNLVQTRSGNPALLEFLEGLVARAWANLAAPRMANPIKALWAVLRHRFPAAVREEWRLVALATAIFLAGALFGFTATMIDEQTAQVFLPPSHTSQKPSERVAELEKMEREGKTRVNNPGDHAMFTTLLFTHNIKVTGLAFVLGLTFGLGTMAILFYNGATLGSLAALYLNDGVILFFVAWIGPHGSIELPCVFLGAGAGLMMARAQYRRDLGSLWHQMRGMRTKMVHMFIGTACLLVIAGVVEGGFSQVNEPTLPYPLKVAVAIALFASLLLYLFKIPVKADAEHPNRLSQ